MQGEPRRYPGYKFPVVYQNIPFANPYVQLLAKEIGQNRNATMLQLFPTSVRGFTLLPLAAILEPPGLGINLPSRKVESQ